MSVELCEEDDVGAALRRSAWRVHAATTNAPARLAMLWASELRVVTGSGRKASRHFSITRGADSMTGAEVRRGVCEALRARPFPRGDTPILSERFPAPSVGSFS